jgi:hypothetical protein
LAAAFVESRHQYDLSDFELRRIQRCQFVERRATASGEGGQRVVEFDCVARPSGRRRWNDDVIARGKIVVVGAAQHALAHAVMRGQRAPRLGRPHMMGDVWIAIVRLGRQGACESESHHEHCASQLHISQLIALK